MWARARNKLPVSHTDVQDIRWTACAGAASMCILRVGEFILALMGPEQVSKDVKRVTGA